MEESVVLENNMKDTKFAKWVDLIFYILVFAFIGYQLYYIRAIPYEPPVHAIIHMGFALALCTWAKLRKVPHTPANIIPIFLILIGSIAVTAYFFFGYKTILANPSYPPFIALVFGVIATVLAMAVVRWSYGWLFPIFSLLGLLYILYGRHIPGLLKANSSNLQRAITLLAADVTSPFGLYGNLLALSANYLFLFIIFGSVLHAFGGLRFIMQLGNLVSSKLRSGPAALAVISSALMGSITGSTVANITITGAFTIPMMKKAGYKPYHAAAIEAAASNGGQFLPPVMGATVFVMSSYTGIPYLEIAKAAVIAALVYYVMLLLYAELNARKLDLTHIPVEINYKGLLLDAPLFIVPLTMLVVMLMKGFSLMAVIFWSIAAVVVLGLLSGLRKDARIDWQEVREKFADGALTGANVAVLLAVIGVPVAAIEVTGLTLKLSVLFGNLAGNNLLLLLIFTMITAIILGTAVPTPAAYVIVATVLSPILIKNGLPKMQAHLFPMFYAFLSHLTPPVGIGLLVACKLAGSKYLEGAIEVWKAAFPSLLLPFFFVYSPAVLLQYDKPIEVVWATVGMTLAFFTMAVLFHREWKYKLTLLEGLLMTAASLFSLYYILLDKNPLWIIISLVLSAATLLINMNRRGPAKQTPA